MPPDFGDLYPLDALEIKQTLHSTAEMMADLFRELHSHGFTRREAVKLTLGWMQAVIAQQPGEE